MGGSHRATLLTEAAPTGHSAVCEAGIANGPRIVQTSWTDIDDSWTEGDLNLTWTVSYLQFDQW